MVIFPADEVKRKLFHLLSLLYIAGYWLLPLPAVLWSLGAVIAVVVVGETVRLNSPVFNEWILASLGGVHRKEETNRLSGLPWTLSGSFFTMLLFPDKRIVILSFLYLAFGDALAAIIGRTFGKRRIAKGKTLEGSAACFCACFLSGLFFFSWPLALLGAFLATIVELIPWPLNDNFWMPLVSATFLTFLFPLLKV